MRIVTIIQARMGSSRLPGKVMMELTGGKTMLAHTIDRCRLIRQSHEVVVATTTDPWDEEIVEFCSKSSVRCVRGSVNDVLDRYCVAAEESNADVVVRVTADMPLLDPVIHDYAIHAYLMARGRYDLVQTSWDGGYCHGLYAQLMSRRALLEANRLADEHYQRVHVGPYIQEHPEKFPALHLRAPTPLPELRLTVDEPADLVFIRALCAELQKRDNSFHIGDILDVIEEHPELLELNRKVKHKEVKDG